MIYPPVVVPCPTFPDTFTWLPALFIIYCQDVLLPSHTQKHRIIAYQRCNGNSLTHYCLLKWPPFRRQHFQMHFFIWMSIRISVNFISAGSINNSTALVQIMARRQPSDRPLSQPTIVILLTNVRVPQPEWIYTELPEIFHKQSNCPFCWM